jgi:iron(III) transport system ATP-binding protein
MKAAAIEFQNVSKRYGEVAAVEEVSFAIAAGTLVTLLGPSGCGKTTTLRMIAGLELPTAGTIRIGGADVTRCSGSPARRVDGVSELRAVPAHDGAGERELRLTVSGLAKPQVREKAQAALATVGLTASMLACLRSLGAAAAVAVARALVLEPAVLLFDEPLSNLDARLRRQMREEIRELQQRLSLTVVHATHDQAEAMAVSDRIIVMNKGDIAQEGAPRELYEQPRDVFVAGFMGEASRVRGTLKRLDERMGELALGPLTLRLPHRGLPEGRSRSRSAPESVAILPDGGAGLPGTVAKAAYLGGLMEYTIATVLGNLFVVDTAVEQPRASRRGHPAACESWRGADRGGATSPALSPCNREDQARPCT